MKNFKEFIKDYEDGNFTYSDKTFAYAAYCQGYAEGMKDNLNNLLSAPITLPQIPLSSPAYIEELNAQYERDKKEQGSGRDKEGD